MAFNWAGADQRRKWRLRSIACCGRRAFNWAGADQRRKFQGIQGIQGERGPSIGPALISAGNAAVTCALMPDITLQLGRR